MSYRDMVKNTIPGWTGRLWGDSVLYLGNGAVHRDVPYDQNSPTIIQKKLTLAKRGGIQAIRGTWQGPWSASCHAVAIETAKQCGVLGMHFALLLDPGGMQRWQPATQEQITTNVINALSDSGTQAILNGASYIPQKWVFDFGTGADLNILAQTFPHLVFCALWQHYSWPQIPWDASHYASMNANPDMHVAGVCASFDDSGQPIPAGVQSATAWQAAGSKRDYLSSVWGGPARRLAPHAGQFLRSQLLTVPSHCDISIVTLDDYDEQSSGPLELDLAKFFGEGWQ